MKWVLALIAIALLFYHKQFDDPNLPDFLLIVSGFLMGIATMLDHRSAA